MAIAIVPHEAQWKTGVLDFNESLAGHEGFYVDSTPTWIPKSTGASVWREYWLAVEDQTRVVGAYGLKPQKFLIDGHEISVADWQGPVSLGQIEPRYNTLGLRMVRDMLKKQPELYSWGHGGQVGPVPDLLRKLGWLLHPTPVALLLTKPQRVLEQLPALQQSDFAWAIPILSSIPGLDLLFKAKAWMGDRRDPDDATLTFSIEPTFGSWADAAWERGRTAYDFVAVRTSEILNRLMPRSDQAEWKEPVRLRVRHRGQDIGWAAVLITHQPGHSRFGDLRFGSIIDVFAHPGDAPRVISVAKRYLKEHDLDLILSNNSHPVWQSALRRSGFLMTGGRRLFAASPVLRQRLSPWPRFRDNMLLTNMDGHGPMGL